MVGTDGNDACDPARPGRGRPAWRDHASDAGGMGTFRCPAAFFLRSVPRSASQPAFANAIIILYLVTALLGAIVYLYFKVDVQPDLERDRHWQALGLFELKEDFLAIGLGLLPAYWVCWRRPLADERGWTRAALTAVLAFIIWWGFLVGHVMNDIMGFGS